MSISSNTQITNPERNVPQFFCNMKTICLTVFALITGGRVQTLPSGQVRIIFKWHYFVISLLVACVGTFVIANTTSSISLLWNKADPNDDESIFLPFTSRKVPAKWRHSITNQPLNHPTHHPKLYYPRNCPHQQHSKLCAKPVPSFIFAGSEFAGASYVFRMLKEHPQVAATSVDNSHPNQVTHVFDSEDYDEANAFDSYIAQFPFLKDDGLATTEENWIVGENAPHYLYQSHLTAKRIKDNLPHVKLVFFLRDPIARAYSQYQSEKKDSKLSFETLIDLELPILRRCGHTSTQTGWEGFVRCHQGSEIRASWKVSNDTHTFNSLAKGMYYPALVPFLQQFSPSQLFIIRTEDILLNPSGSFQRLAMFLDIDPTFFAERNFYQNEQHLTEEELINTQLDHHHQQPDEYSNNSSIDHFLSFPQKGRNVLLQQRTRHVNNHHNHRGMVANDEKATAFQAVFEEPILSTRYRLQKVYRHLNNRLIDLFDHTKTTFTGWIYDVDRG